VLVFSCTTPPFPCTRSRCWALTRTRCSKLRIKDPKVSVPFYETHFGLRLVDRQVFDKFNFSVYFLAHFEAEDECVDLPEVGSAEAHARVWNTNQFCLMLTHNHGTENQDDFAVCSGNAAPHRGFGHIAFNVSSGCCSVCVCVCVCVCVGIYIFGVQFYQCFGSMCACCCLGAYFERGRW
jgi:catechol 2,3-dioxygenase-like lactoylglutathione lyase family enzyme